MDSRRACRPPQPSGKGGELDLRIERRVKGKLESAYEKELGRQEKHLDRSGEVKYYCPSSNTCETPAALEGQQNWIERVPSPLGSHSISTILRVSQTLAVP